jgi:hypothetical protein
MKQFLKIFLPVFIGFTLIFIPVTWQIFPFHGEITSFVFGSILKQIAISINTEMILFDFSSDSKGLYFLVSLLIILSIVITPFLLRFVKMIHLEKFKSVITIIATYYLAAILLKYGFDKVFKAQFYLPEPNILYTPLGKLDKDILFWSTMGTSHAYNLFMGFVEVIPAVMLLFKRTREIGLIISFAVLLNVLAINLSFDISVKLLASFLLFVNLFLLLPTIQLFWKALVLKEAIIPSKTKPSVFDFHGKLLVKSVVIAILFLESTIPYLRTLNFNDDSAARPYLHGAYEVVDVQSSNLHLKKNEFPFKRIFIHRDGYMIFQDQQDGMTDFKLEFDSQAKKIKLISYDRTQQQMNYTYDSKDSTLVLSFINGDHRTRIQSKAINWRAMPLLQHQFHWTVD